MASDTPVSIEVADAASPSIAKDASGAPLDQPSDISAASKPSHPAMDTREINRLDSTPSGSALGQFSFAPATRTTVVTTTTTTTTSFPPLVIKPPHATKHLDAKLYPLASSPTPSALKNLKFDLGGKLVTFNEPEDTSSAVKEASQQALLASLPLRVVWLMLDVLRLTSSAGREK